jgi:hypothetical protein
MNRSQPLPLQRRKERQHSEQAATVLPLRWFTNYYIFAISIACLASLAHDLPDSFLGAIGLLNQRAYEVALNSPTIWRTILLTLYGLSILWFIVLFPKAIGAAQRIRRGPGVFVGVLAYLVYQFVFVIFNR